MFLHIENQSARVSRDSSLLLRRSPCGKHTTRNIACVHVHNPTYTILMGDAKEECLREERPKQRRCLESFAPPDTAGAAAFRGKYSLSCERGENEDKT